MHAHTQEFLRIEAKQGELWPVVTVGQHAACCLGFNTEHPHLLVTGGRNNQDAPVEGTWLFDVVKKKWNEVTQADWKVLFPMLCCANLWFQQSIVASP